MCRCTLREKAGSMARSGSLRGVGSCNYAQSDDADTTKGTASSDSETASSREVRFFTLINTDTHCII